MDNICHGNPLWFAWWMTWAADIFQNPGSLKGSAIIHHGEGRGTGKTLPFDMLRDALGGDKSLAIKVRSRKFLTGDFNAHHGGKLFLQAEEVTWGGNKDEEGKLKDMVTADTTIIERKGVDGIPMSNYMRIGISSNERWAVPTAQTGERRWFVLGVLPTLQGKPEAFAAIARQMHDEGGLAAMVFELQHWRPEDHGLTWQSLRQPPVTEALNRQAREGLDASQRFFIELIDAGEVSAPLGKIVKAQGDAVDDTFLLPAMGGNIATDALRQFHDAWVRKRGGNECRRARREKGSFSRQWRKILWLQGASAPVSG